MKAKLKELKDKFQPIASKVPALNYAHEVLKHFDDIKYTYFNKLHVTNYVLQDKQMSS